MSCQPVMKHAMMDGVLVSVEDAKNRKSTYLCKFCSKEVISEAAHV
jgi:hypothetical protein